MTFKQIEKEFDDNFLTKDKTDWKHDLYDNVTVSKDEVKSFLKQSFIKYLKDECERLEQEKNSDEEIQFFMQGHPTSTDRYIGGKFAGANEVIDNQIKYYKAQIKELESLSN